MKVSLRRKPFLNAVLPVLLFSTAAFAGKSPFDLGYTLRFTSRAGIHLTNAADLAINRHTLEVEQTIKAWNSWSAVVGGRVYADSAFSMNDRYNAPVRGIESQEFAPRDLYLQYKGHGIQFRLGNQQVVWGESFGFFFADIVNPKDTREGGLGGDLAAQRIMTPIANLTWLLGDHSLQFVFIPKSFGNLTPAPGSDFAPPFSSFFPTTTFSVQDDRIKPTALSNSEFGFRGTTMIKGWDLSAFYLYYFDRRPSYRPEVNGSSILLRGVHDPLSSFGITGTKDLDTWVTRFELLYTRNRPVDAYDPTQATPQLNYYSTLSDEIVGVLGFDYTQWRDWRLTLQVAQDSYFKNIPGALIRQHSTNLSVILGGTLFHNHELTLIASYCPNDGGSLSQILYMVPLSNRLEATFGAYLFAGPPGSQYGGFQSANRAFVQLRAFFGSG